MLKAELEYINEEDRVMKKILILLTAFCCCGCGSTEIDATQNTPKYYKEMNWVKDGIYSVEVEGHIYIVFDGAYCGNIIHAEHCPCKAK